MTMIQVVCSDGSTAEAHDPASAVYAAKTLCQEAWKQRPVQGHTPTASFYVDDVVVQLNVPESALWRYA